MILNWHIGIIFHSFIRQGCGCLLLIWSIITWQQCVIFHNNSAGAHLNWSTVVLAFINEIFRISILCLLYDIILRATRILNFLTNRSTWCPKRNKTLFSHPTSHRNNSRPVHPIYFKINVLRFPIMDSAHQISTPCSYHFSNLAISICHLKP